MPKLIETVQELFHLFPWIRCLLAIVSAHNEMQLMLETKENKMLYCQGWILQLTLPRSHSRYCRARADVITPYIPITNQVWGPYYKLQIAFFSIQFMAQVQSTPRSQEVSNFRIRTAKSINYSAWSTWEIQWHFLILTMLFSLHLSDSFIDINN